MSNEGEGKREAAGQGSAPGRGQAGDGRGRDGEDASGEPSDGEVQQDRVATLEGERDEMKDRMLRIAAEFENWKKRARKEQEDAEGKSRESVLRDMLDVMDNLERALGAYGHRGDKTTHKPAGKSEDRPVEKVKKGGDGADLDAQGLLKGVELVLRLFQSKLERYGVKQIAAQGQPFDPRLHEAISRVETADVPAGHVAVEMQRGYRIGDRLLRPAMVSVAAAPSGNTDSGHPGGGGIKGGNGVESGNRIEKDGA